MKNNEAIQLGTNRYLQGCGVLDCLGEETAALGGHPLILADPAVYPKVKERVERSLKNAGLSWTLRRFEGGCCAGNYEPAARQGKEAGCDVVIGIGGGRAMDTAKIASDKMGVRAVTVPTSAATCASTALLAVHYSDDGHFLGNYWPRCAPAVTLADLDVIIKDCPPRLNAAGIVDAMAKFPEIDYNIRYTENWKKNVMSRLARDTAESTFRLLLEHGVGTVEKTRQGRVDDAAEDVIAAALSITGFISCLACGGKQAAVSHGLYSYFCNEMPQTARRFLHGELVGASLPYQMAVCGYDVRETEAFVRFLRKTGCPASLRELGVETTPAAMERMFAFLKKALPVETDAEMERLRRYESVLTNGL